MNEKTLAVIYLKLFKQAIGKIKKFVSFFSIFASYINKNTHTGC